MILDDGKGGMGQQIRPFQDGPIELEGVILVTGGQDRDRPLRDGSCVFRGDDFRHGLFLRKRGGVQQGLRQAVAYRRMQ